MIIKNNFDIIKTLIFEMIKIQINLLIFIYFIPSMLDGIILMLFKIYITQNLIASQFIAINILSLAYEIPEIISEIILLDTKFKIKGKQKEKIKNQKLSTLILISFVSSINQLQNFPIIIVKYLYYNFNYLQ